VCVRWECNLLKLHGPTVLSRGNVISLIFIFENLLEHPRKPGIVALILADRLRKASEWG